MSTSRPLVRPTVVAALADLVVVLAFASIGRSSHAESVSLSGVFATAWPFALALVGGWLITRAWRSPFSLVRTGVGVWVVTVAGGLLLRLVSGQGIAFGFVIVTTIVLGLGLLGWRVCAALIGRAVHRSSDRRHRVPIH